MTRNSTSVWTTKYLTKISAQLSDILAATYRLTIKSHLYHWNVVGPLFKPLHELTEEHYNALFAATDIIAERIRALGHLAPVRLGDAAAFAPKVSEVKNTSAIDMIEDLIADHSDAVKTMRKGRGNGRRCWRPRYRGYADGAPRLP